MKYAMFTAMGVGYIGGITLSYFLSKWMAYRTSENIPRTVGSIFGMLALIPAVLLGTIVGGNLGGVYGGAVSESLGQGTVGVPIGLALGILSTIVLVVCTSTYIGVLLGKVSNALLENQ